ncbi:PREDICTED: engulfment and cell motility protein 1-like [Amphimedon queenslandica]|uniref:ELMO domain-containing protein n=1 Tax=Amphimedon queenslandica TaxID=400682 RepID=A0A1X7UWA1_AMPQE|nr:PREDICTED: engulfment and cell motility protein 1-like [Amphimedon queenslandica]|eukprot:XP_003386618.1 PREDICTED: engulfment and cell motility protein 1-like [Amphimedon queenslandica]
MSLTSSISLVGGPATSSTSGKQDRVKVAIEPDPANKMNVQPILRDFEHSIPLSSILKEVASRWNIERPETLSFKYSKDSKGKFGYVTEDNRQELKNGDILCIALSPSYQAKETYDKVNSGDPQIKMKGIEELLSLSRDSTFAVEFISMNNGTGIQTLLVMTEKSQLSPGADKSPPLADKSNLSNVLGAFQELMEHGIVSWDTVGDNFVKKVVNILDRSRDRDYFRPSIVHRCMGILESIVMNSSLHYHIVTQEVNPQSLLEYIRKDSPEVTHYTLVLINALLAKADNQRELLRQLSEQNFSRIIHDNILQRGPVDRDIAHQLSIYQSFILNQVEGRMRTSFRDGDSTMETLLKQLPHRAFSDEYRSKGSIAEQHWKQLGFSQANPRDDFRETPPGLLALDCMEYLARTKHDVYTRLLFAQMDNPCPFAKTSVALTKVLCSIFRIGEQPADISYNVTEFIPLLILNEEPFKEIYCITIQLLFKTWREMRAGILDLEKVTAVVTKQITTVIQSQDASTLTSSDTFRNRLFELSYKKITESEEHTQLLDESVLKSRPVQDLKKKITPEINELVKRERLNHLVHGSAFPKVGAKRRDQYFYCRLHPNHKVIHFGDAAGHGQTAPPLESLDNKIQVSEMRLVIGNECPHAERLRKGSNMIFSIFYNSNEHLDFCAPTETVHNIWVDGLSVLLDKDMPSKAAEEDLETLVNMDLKLRLLDLENISIPSQPPVKPADPPSFDFYYKLD